MNAIGYIRVSTDKQAETGISLDAQTAKIQAMAVVQGTVITEIIVDAESAKTLDRPGMDRLLQLVESRSVSTVIVAKLDRLTRSVKDLANLLELFAKRGVSLVSVAESLDTGSAAGRLVLNIMVSVSQWEREAIGERTRDAMRHKKASGKVYNHVPYGFVRLGDALLSKPSEQRVASRILALHSSGSSLRQIANDLNGDKVPTKQAGRWHASTIRNVIANGSMYTQDRECTV